MAFSSNRFRHSYLVALTAVAALTLAAQWLVQTALDRAEGDASVINLAGRQRMLSQKLAKAAWASEFAGEPSSRRAAEAELEEALDALDLSHAQLAQQVAGDSGLEIQYARVDVLFDQLSAATRAKLAGAQQDTSELLVSLSTAEAAFLPEMNRLVGVFEEVADGRISRLRRVELGLLLATLLVLTLEAFLIFEPLRRALLQRVDELTDARDVAERATRVQDEFLSAMSHEIRTPLNAVIGMSELLLESELTPQQCELAKTCNESSQVLLSLVNDILDYAKLESGEVELEVLDLEPEPLVIEVAQLVAPRLGSSPVELVVEGPREPDLRVRADSLRVRQVLINLASNAVKFTREGQVTLRWYLDPKAEARPSLVFEVQDTGIGIPPERLEAIFERFTQADSSTTREFGGTGLGLALSREWTKRMGGDLEVESELGRGSLFRFRLPLDTAPVGTVPESAGVARDHRVALVLAHPEQRAAHARLLAQLGAELLEFGTTEALSSLPASELAQLDAVIVAREALEGWTLPEGIAPERVIALGRAGEALEQAESADGQRLGGILHRPVRRAALEAALGALWSSHERGATDPVAPSAPDRLRGLKVLAVEDNPVNRRLLEAHLKHFGCESVFACDGLEALERARDSEFGLVLMDCQMPRMDGYTASTELRGMPEGKDVVILALSANTQPEHALRCEAACIDDWISKPYTRDDLRKALLRWIDRVPGRRVA